jgi:hypothetical protein
MNGAMWFSLGFFCASFFGMIISVTPTRAAENLKEWGRFLK